MKTAVEYLVEQLMPKALTAEQYYHIEKAKEMEKEQIMEAHKWGGMELESSEQYYNETFKSE